MNDNSTYQKEKETTVIGDYYRQVTKTKAGTIVLWGGIIVGSIYLASLLMRLMTHATKSYRGLRDSLK